jgi:hypothetical protein
LGVGRPRAEARKRRNGGLSSIVCAPERRDRTGWLTWQDSNFRIPFLNSPFEISRLFGANSQIPLAETGPHQSCDIATDNSQLAGDSSAQVRGMQRHAYWDELKVIRGDSFLQINRVVPASLDR